MNARETMAFKAMLKRIAAEENVPAQVVLQNYMFERLMARLVKLPLRKNLILKGGLLVSHLLGLSRRTTMDMDVTLRNAELSEATVRDWMERILSVDVGDGVGWTLKSIAPIRDDDIYGGYRVKMTASLGAITVPLSMDVSTGDAITPAAQEYYLKSHFVQNSVFKMWGYAVETILAEKVETILVRGVLTTRPRDFYDVVLLSRHCPVDLSVFRKALKATARHRGTEDVLTDAGERMKTIAADKGLIEQWNRYVKTNSYVEEVTFADACAVLAKLLKGDLTDGETGT